MQHAACTLPPAHSATLLHLYFVVLFHFRIPQGPDPYGWEYSAWPQAAGPGGRKIGSGCADLIMTNCKFFLRERVVSSLDKDIVRKM